MHAKPMVTCQALQQVHLYELFENWPEINRASHCHTLYILTCVILCDRIYADIWPQLSAGSNCWRFQVCNLAFNLLQSQCEYYTYTYPRSYYKPIFDQQVYPRSDMFLVHPCPAIFFQLQKHWPLLLYNKWIQDNANKCKNVFHILPCCNIY